MRKLVVVLAILGLASAACGTNETPTVEDETVSPAATATATAAVNDHGTKTFTTETFETELELDDFYFEPTNIKAPGGATATLELFNEGDADHTFTVDALDIDEELEPDARKTIEVELGDETRYEFYCRYHGDQGMRGAFSLH